MFQTEISNQDGLPYDTDKSCDMASKIDRRDNTKDRDVTAIYLLRGVRGSCPVAMRSII